MFKYITAWNGSLRKGNVLHLSVILFTAGEGVSLLLPIRGMCLLGEGGGEG